MSTHEHLIVTDTQGRHPEFLRRLHRLVSLGTKVLRKWAVKRPTAYFRADNRQWPESIDVSLTLPPSLQRRYGADALHEAVQLELERQERLAHQEVRARGWRVLGAERVRRLSPYRRATSFEPLRDRNPTCGVGRGQRKVLFQAVADLRAFRRAYQQALEQWRTGLRSVVFPQGTWGMRRMHGAVART